MVDFNPTISIITFKGNGISKSTKIQGFFRLGFFFHKKVTARLKYSSV